MRNTSSQLTEMDSLIKIYEDTINDVKSSFISNLEKIGCTQLLAENLIRRNEDHIKSLSLSEIDELIVKSGCDPDFLKTAYYHANDKSLAFIDFSIDTLLKIKEKYLSIIDSEENLESLKEERLNISRSFVDMLKSPEYRQARMDQIELLKKQAEETEDPKVRKDLLERLSHIEKSQTFEFLNERLHKYGKKEANSIKDGFFERSRGVYIMNRYYERLDRMKINRSIHSAFFNLEEEYLPESYAPFNNFFLFHIIRWVSYVDPDVESDFLYMSSLMGALKDLVTGEATKEEEQTILSVMKDFYSFYQGAEVEEYFIKNNANYKNHPDRIQAEKLAKQKREAKALESIKTELGELFDDETYKLQACFNPEEYLKQILEEKEKMLDALKDQKTNFVMPIGHPKYATYEIVFNAFKKYQEVISKESEEVNENEPESETVECGDEITSDTENPGSQEDCK